MPEQKPDYHQEAERASLDLIRVYNPLEQDFTVRWHTTPHVIPSKNRDIGHGMGMSIMVRYMARHYAKHVTDYILLRQADAAVKAENERRIAHGMKKMTKNEEQLDFEKEFSHKDMRRRMDVYRMVWKGLYQRHGGNVVEEMAKDDLVPRNDIDLLKMLEEDMGDSAKVEEAPAPQAQVPTDNPLPNLETMDYKQLQKEATKVGINPVGKKKDELLERLSDENN